MAFWGVQVRGGRPVVIRSSERGRLRLSQATLGIGDAIGRTILQCNVGNRAPVFLCSLLPNNIESCHLEVEFEEADDVIFSVIGPRTVHLSGYYVRHLSNAHSDSETNGFDIQNSSPRESGNGSEESGYGGSFINDGDDLEGSPAFPVSKSEEMGEITPKRDKQEGKKGRRLKKKSEVSDSGNSRDDTESYESEDDDGYLLSVFKTSKKKPAHKLTALGSEEKTALPTGKIGENEEEDDISSPEMKEKFNIVYTNNDESTREANLQLDGENEKSEIPEDVVTTERTIVDDEKIIADNNKVESGTVNQNLHIHNGEDLMQSIGHLAKLEEKRGEPSMEEGSKTLETEIPSDGENEAKKVFMDVESVERSLTDNDNKAESNKVNDNTEDEMLSIDLAKPKEKRKRPSKDRSGKIVVKDRCDEKKEHEHQAVENIREAGGRKPKKLRKKSKQEGTSEEVTMLVSEGKTGCPTGKIGKNKEENDISTTVLKEKINIAYTNNDESTREVNPQLDGENEKNEIPKEVAITERTAVDDEKIITCDNKAESGTVNQDLHIHNGEDLMQSLDHLETKVPSDGENEMNEVPMEVESIEQSVTNDDIKAESHEVDRNLLGDNAEDELLSLDLVEPKEKRKRPSKERSCKIVVDKDQCREKNEYEPRAVENTEAGRRRVVLALAVASEDGSNSKNVQKESKQEGTCEEETALKAPENEKRDQTIVGDLPAADSEDQEPIDKTISMNELHAGSHLEKKIRTKKKKKPQDKENLIADGMSNMQNTSLTEDENQVANMTPNLESALSNGLVIEVLKNGPPDGKLAAQGKKVKIYFTGILKESGRTFDSNVGKTAHRFRLGDEEYIDGLNIGIDGMRVGEKRILTIPPSLGYGDHGCGEKVPPNAWVVYEVELMGVRK